MRIRASILLVTMFALGCAAPSPTATAGPSDEASPQPLATIDAGELVGGRLTCGDGNTFPAVALQGPGGAELGEDAAAAAMRAELAGGGDPQLPRSGWHRVAGSDSRAQFVARGVGTPWVSIAVEKGPSGWTLDSAGECHLAVLVGAGVGHATWWLDPAAGPVGPATRQLQALVHEDACASGRAPVGRVVPPLIAYGDDAVVVVLGVVPLPGDQDCPGAPPAPYTIDLREPLGNRALLDGGVVPPRDATKPPN
jgi:hypothetical protein